MAIKVVALDIYGTVLATEDPENALPFSEYLLLFQRVVGRFTAQIQRSGIVNLYHFHVKLKSGASPRAFFMFYRSFQIGNSLDFIDNFF